MSAPTAKGPLARLLEIAALGALFAIMLGLDRFHPSVSGEWQRTGRDLAAIGFFLLAGSLASSILEILRLPHLTGFLLVGIVAGPHVLHAVNHDTVVDLGVVNSLALSLIALAGGAELRLEAVRRGFSSLLSATLVQNGLALVVLPVTFILARDLVPFTRGMPLPAVFAVAMLWGVVAITRSPSAVMGILSQTRPAGKLTDFTVGFVMTSDVVVVILLAVVTTAVRPLLEPGAALSLSAFAELGHELLGSVAIGTTLGLLLVAYLRFVGRQVLLVLLLLGLVVVEVITYLRFEWLLTFLTAGFVVQNFSRQGGKLLHAIEHTGEVVYVIFFALAGAHLDLPLLGTLWKAALLFFAVRAVTAVVGARISGRLAGDPPALRTWGWAGLVSQAGLALGIAARMQGQFPSFGAQFGALAVAAVALNELVGPVIFKLALDRSGETQKGAPAEGEAQG
jgi:Kef-type K+ transport system membrane component KefB